MNDAAPADPPAAHPHPAPHRERVSPWKLALSLVLPPAAWFLQLSIDSVLASQACYPGDVPLVQPRIDASPIVLACDLVLLVVAVIGVFVGWRSWRHTAGEKPGGGHHLMESGDGRTRFMAMAGVLTSGIVLLAGLYALLAHLSVGWCGT